jgi:hypothetical protein
MLGTEAQPLEASTTQDEPRAWEALQAVIEALQPLDAESRRRVIDATTTFFRLETSRRQASAQPSAERSVSSPTYPPFSAETAPSPKEFLLEKQPRTDVERIACLAYYLTHYRDMPQFKTLDLSKLNTEAAQPKFSNAASSANNAVKRGYLVPTTKGQRQLSAAGERFVQALPDREAARNAMASFRPRKRSSRPRTAARTSRPGSAAAIQ